MEIDKNKMEIQHEVTNNLSKKEILEEYLPDEQPDNTEEDRKVISTDLTYTHEIHWPNLIIIFTNHVLAVIAIYQCLKGRVYFATILWALFYAYVATVGAHAGAHRCFSHRAFKAKPPFKILLLLMQVVSGQNSALRWARDHRLHHRYSDTDGDPHNSKRGMFYSHVGWLATKRHPICIALRETIDMSDLYNDKYVMWQYKYFVPIYILLGILLPVAVPIYFFNETFLNAVLVAHYLRYVWSLNMTWLVNSVAHKYGTRPYDKNLQPVEHSILSLLTVGEGWHNYHHAFPVDYKTSELGMPFNFTSSFIEFFAKIGQAYDLRSASPEVIENRIKRTGDGTHKVLGDPDFKKKGIVTSFGPQHPLNPTYRVTYPDPIPAVIVRRKWYTKIPDNQQKVKV